MVRLGSTRKYDLLRERKEMLEHKVQVDEPLGSRAGEVGWFRAGSTCPLYQRSWEPLKNFKAVSNVTDPVHICPE